MQKRRRATGLRPAAAAAAAAKGMPLRRCGQCAACLVDKKKRPPCLELQRQRLERQNAADGGAGLEEGGPLAGEEEAQMLEGQRAGGMPRTASGRLAFQGDKSLMLFTSPYDRKVSTGAAGPAGLFTCDRSQGRTSNAFCPICLLAHSHRPCRPASSTWPTSSSCCATQWPRTTGGVWRDWRQPCWPLTCAPAACLL